MNFSNCSVRIALILLVCVIPGLVAMDLLPMLENFFGSLGWRICKNKCVENPTPELIDFMLNPPQVTNGTQESTTEEHMDFIPVPPQEFVPTKPLETTHVESTVPAEYDSTTFSGTSTTSVPTTTVTSLVTTTPMPTTLPVTTTTTPKPTTPLTTTPKPTTPLPPTTIAPAMQPREAEVIMPKENVQVDHRGFTAWTLLFINLSLLILIILVVLMAYFYGSKRNRSSNAPTTTTVDTNEQVEMVPLTSVTSTTDSPSSPDQVEETEIVVNDDSPATDAAAVSEGEQEEPESVPVPHGRLTRMRIQAARNAFLNDQSLAVTTQRGPLCPWFP